MTIVSPHTYASKGGPTCFQHITTNFPPSDPVSVPKAQCDVFLPKDPMSKDATCPNVFKTFTEGTRNLAWFIQTPEERQATLDNFCTTSCGATYTATLAGRRRGCKTPTPKGKKEGHVVPDGPSEFLLHELLLW